MKCSWLFLWALVAASSLAVDTDSVKGSSLHEHKSGSAAGGQNQQAGDGTPSELASKLRQKMSDKTARSERVDRCRARELSPGSALGIMVVLATGCAVHMPGSVIMPKRRGFLYRLAPELGILEAMAVLLLTCKGLFLYQKSLKISVMAALTMRYFKAEGELWWKETSQDSPADSTGNLPTAASCYESSEPFFDRIRGFGRDRILGNILMILALTKALAVRGTIRTNLLAASYGLSFFTIELLSLGALHIGPTMTKQKLEEQAIEGAALIKSMDNSYYGRELFLADAKRHDSKDLRRSMQALIEESRRPFYQNLALSLSRLVIPRDVPSGALLELVAYGVITVFRLAAAFHLGFWPFSVLLFAIGDMQLYQRGHFGIVFMTSVEWTFFIAAAAGALALLATLPGYLLWRHPEQQKKYWKQNRIRQENIFNHIFRDGWFFCDLFPLLKFTLIVRYYLWTYTGQGTVVPTWVNWLG